MLNIDHVEMVEADLLRAAQSSHHLDKLRAAALEHLDQVPMQPDAEVVADEPRRHRVRPLAHADRAEHAHGTR